MKINNHYAKLLLNIIALCLAVPSLGMQRPPHMLAHYYPRLASVAVVNHNSNLAWTAVAKVYSKNNGSAGFSSKTKDKHSQSNDQSTRTKEHFNSKISALFPVIKKQTFCSYFPVLTMATVGGIGLGLAYYLISDDDKTIDRDEIRQYVVSDHLLSPLLSQDILLSNVHAGVSCTQPLLAPRSVVDHYHSAGILPYAIDDHNEIWLLVGLDGFRNDLASDFGGGKDGLDRNRSVQTAAREGAEELLFLFDKAPQEFSRLLHIKNKYKHYFDIEKSNAETYNFLIKQLENVQTTASGHFDGYTTYFTKIKYDPELPSMFSYRKKQYSKRLPSCWNEKSSIHWVKLNILLDGIKQKDNNGSVTIIENGTQLYFFDKFIESMIAAEKNKIFHFLQTNKHQLKIIEKAVQI